MAKQKVNERETTIYNVKSRKQPKIPMPIMLSLGMLGFWITYKVMCVLYMSNQGMDVSGFLNPLGLLFSPDLVMRLSMDTIILPFLVGFIIVCSLEVRNSKIKKVRTGREMGSARFNESEDSLPFRDPDYLNNTIFTQTEFFSQNESISGRNRNIILLGKQWAALSF